MRYAGTPHLFSEETVGQLTITIQANNGAETLSTEIPYVVLGAPIDVTPRAIPTPYLPNGQPSKSIDTVLATFTDPDLLSGPQEFTAVIRWGDGSVENNELSTNVWITGSAGVFSVRGRHTFPAPGTYPIIVEISEDQHSRDSAVSSVVIGTPTVPPLGQIWSRMYCDGSTLIGTGNPPLDFNVLNQTVRGLGTTLEGQPGVAFVNAVVGSFEYENEAGAALSALVRWEAGGNWESATVAGGHIVGTHTYTAPGSYPIEVVLVLDDTYRALDEVTQLCTTYPRQRTVNIYSGATIVTPSPVVTTHAKTVSAGSSFAAKDLVTAAGLTAKAVAIVEWGDGTQSLDDFYATSQLVGSHH